MKRCGLCGEEKPLSEFYTCKYNGHQSSCKSCQKARSARDLQLHPEKHHAWQLKRKYGISMGDYLRMLDEQGGVCAICESSDPGRQNKFFSVDHHHGSGLVRGLLCHSCNAGLGYFRDHPENLIKAAEYLEVRCGA